MSIEANTWIRLFLLLLIVSFMTPIGAHAGSGLQRHPADLTELSLEELMNIEVATVYAASKYEQKVTQAPSSISVVTSQEIKKYGYRNLSEILQSIRGFQFTNDRNYEFINVRGFGLPGDYNSRILLLIDGHRINNNVYNQAMLGTDFPVEIDLIERIEVVRGPSSSLYGGSAFFGVINVITLRGSDFKGLEIAGDVGTFETYKTRLSYGNRFQNDLEVLLSGSYFDTQGDDRLFFNEFNDPATNNGIAEDLDYDRSKNAFAEFRFHDFTLQSDYNSRKRGVPTASFETLFDNSSYFTVDEQFWVDLKYEHVYANQVDLLARINYNHSKYYGDYPYEGDPSIGEAEIVMNKDSATGDWLNAELQLTKVLLERHKVTSGAFIEDDIRKDQKSFFIGATDWGDLNDKRETTNWALYVQDEFSITDQLILNAGVRHDDYETFGGTTNPRAALIYSPDEETALKAIYGRAFRAPNAYELYFHDASNTQKPGLDLDPEIIETYELVFEQYVGDHLRGTLVAFYYTIDDLITLQTDPADDLLIYKNVAEVDARGIELELEGKWANGLEGRVSYTLQATENQQTGKTLSNSPKHLAKLNLTFPVLREKVFLGVEEQYTSKRKTVTRNIADAFFVTNLTLSSPKLVKGLDLSVSVYNLFDKHYRDPGSEEHLQDSIEQDGRTVRLKLVHRF